MRNKNIANVILTIFTLISFSGCVVSQNMKELKKDTTIDMLGLFFYLEKDGIYEFYNNDSSEYFYKIFLLKDYRHDFEEFIGEVMDHAYLLKGEFGDYPEGKLYDLGLFYNVISCKIVGRKIQILYNNKVDPKSKEFQIP